MFFNLIPARQIFDKEEIEIRRMAFQHFNITVKMLNESMGMCLPDGSVSRENGQ